MANRTVKDAHSIKGTNPQYLVEKIIRTRIYECRYWKEECFALTAALLVDKAMELRYIGGVYGGNVKPTPFLCLILKMLQIQPEKDIVVEFIRNEDFKYVRALGAFYMRLTGTAMDCYKYLEPLYYDYRKLRRMSRDGKFELIHMDEYIDELIREERNSDIILPRIQKRNVLEESNQLEPRVSAVEEDMEDMGTDEEEELMEESRRSASPENRKSPSPRRRSRSPHKREHHVKNRDERRRSREKEKRHRSRSPGKRQREEEERKRKSKKSRGDRDRHEENRDRHRERGDRGKPDRERERERRHKDKDRDTHKEKDRDTHKEKDRETHKDRSRGHRDRINLDPEIREANELRAKLGLAPLRP
ncbi:pre-mRNA-splicing factor 38A-like [Littorina saxatilis]|uniref:Pre-mRNA-splicing factor 38 n=1 Tax=Littorina saxatilis TaxID=31220 RepID=A0AAN9G9M5_9CAEN